MKHLTHYETMDWLFNKNCSMARFGDGENGMIQKGKGVPTMQEFSKSLKRKLIRCYERPLDNLLICVHNIDTYDYLPDGIYGNAFVTRPTNVPHLATVNYFNKFKMLWEDQDIHVVNFQPRIIGSPMFDNVKSVSFQPIPRQHCFSEYKKIKEDLNWHLGKNKTFLLSCGMAATVLAYELAKVGERALDIGKICFEYGKFSGDSERNLVSLISQNKLAEKHKKWRKKNGVGIHARQKKN